ncbi:hypothetical protein HD597_002187 [Nonomuraea thailandensis]|uniref:Uncharacterized protein n=1 Tax=Nonomuraea thailandensis TaxID=1188745 RepID=A0A9X2GCI9_9ACTN|nr:hypothetical protein [Nonomuraea thailandensis]MCP2355167.1 hypothetical protein [Nonomuraea thailandensis]
MGGTWIGGGLAGTLPLMRRWLRPNGIVLVGERSWTSPPPPEAVTALPPDQESVTALSGTAGRADATGFELLEMVLASGRAMGGVHACRAAMTKRAGTDADAGGWPLR